jgi:hypothetical protein
MSMYGDSQYHGNTPPPPYVRQWIADQQRDDDEYGEEDRPW